MKTETRYNVYFKDKLVIQNEDIKTVIYWVKLFNWNVKELIFDEIKKENNSFKFLTRINPN